MKPLNVRIRHHDLVFQLYREVMKYEDLLEFAGNKEKAEELRTLCQEVSRERVLDSILNPLRD